MNKFEVKTRAKRVSIVVLSIVFLTFFYLLSSMNRNGQVLIGGKVSISGIISAGQFLIAILMTVIDYRIGGTLGHVFLAFSAVFTFIISVIRGDYSSLPGIFYFVAGAIAILLIRSEMGKVTKISCMDALTGISNRKNILDHMEHFIDQKTPFYALYLDLDHFKYVNDIDGHEKGDEVLKAVVDVWKAIQPKHNYLGRIGGDEFVVIAPKKYCDDPESLAYEYLKSFKQLPENISSHALYITVSIGIVAFPEDGQNSDEIIRKADLAMYSAKNQGRNMACIYDDELDKELLREQNIEMKIREALITGKFHMVYQPQYRIKDKQIRGFEALLRMRFKNDEMLSPSEFIPVAEKSELIIAIGELVLMKATKDFAKIVAANPDFLLSVNISAKQILTGDFAGAVEKILDENNFPAKNLEIEITEYCMMDSTNEAIEVINRIKCLGVKIAMDDFGTGYSSLSYLTKIPIDLIKIDKTLIDTIEDGEIIRAISSMGHALSCEIIAEGVEEERQLKVLRTTGCDYVQGFLWSHPLPLESVKDLIQ